MFIINKLSRKVNPSFFHALLLLCFFSSGISLHGQRIQIQAHIGANFSKAQIDNSDNTYLSRETLTFFDTLPFQAGFAVKVKVFRNLYARLDGNYKAYRTYFNVESGINGIAHYVQGNLYNEKFTWSLLPEFQYTMGKESNLKLPVYAYLGPSFVIEGGDNYSDNYLIKGIGTESISTVFKPDNQIGWSFGAGVNPKWKRLGLMLEGRLLKIGNQQEGIVVGKISYQHFTLMAGLTYDLF